MDTIREDRQDKFLRALKQIGGIAKSELVPKVMYHFGAERCMFEILSNIIHDCWICENTAEVAQAVKLMIAYEPQSTSSCLSHVLGFSLADEKWISRHNVITPQFIKGSILGLFWAGAWLKKEWLHNTDFYEKFPDWLSKIINCENSLIDKADATLPDQSYEGQISPAIKEFIAMPGPDEWTKINSFIRDLSNKVAAERKMVYSKLAEMLIKQIYIKYFLNSQNAWEMVSLFANPKT